jgi:gliding motility-associated-like protein
MFHRGIILNLLFYHFVLYGHVLAGNRGNWKPQYQHTEFPDTGITILNFQKQFHPTGNAMEPFCMAGDSTGGYLLAANYYVPSANNFVTRTTAFFHIGEEGCIDWAKSMKAQEEEVIQSVISTADSGFLMTAFPFQAQQDNYPKDLHVYKLDKLGNPVWTRSFSKNPEVTNYYSAIVETADGGFVLEIGSFSSSGIPSSLSVIKIDPAGRLVWGRSLAVETDAFYNVGGIIEKGNLIYATGSISQGVPPFAPLRSFLIELDETNGQLTQAWTNDPLKPILSFTDIHPYKDGLLLNSYAQNLENNLIFLDRAGNYSASLVLSNPYGSLNGKGNLIVSRDNGIYFHQSSGLAGIAHKDIILHLDKNLQITWQYDFTTSSQNFSGWNQLSPAPQNGIAGIGGAQLSPGTMVLTFFTMDSLGNGCNSGQTSVQLATNSVSLVPMTWTTNSVLIMDVNDIPFSLTDTMVESRLVCPKFISACDTIKIDGPLRVCRLSDTARFELRDSLSCADPVKWIYDTSRVKLLSVNDSHLEIFFSVAGNYTIKAQKNGCNMVEDSIMVTVGDTIPKPGLPADTVLCSGSTLKLDAGPGYAQYTWQDGSVNPVLEISDSGTYWVSLTDFSGCTNSDTTRVDSISGLPHAFLLPDTIICTGESLQLKPIQNFLQYHWSTGETSASIKVESPGLYTLNVADRFGCYGIDSIIISTRVCPRGLFFSKAFTPNHDGLNDLFGPRFFVRPQSYRLMIYNRWGQKVFESKDPAAGWDGRIGTMEQETGAYIWFCTYQFAGEDTNSSKGTVLLLR